MIVKINHIDPFQPEELTDVHFSGSSETTGGIECIFMTWTINIVSSEVNVILNH